MADALCGPSNALQNFQKHTSVDRTLQQDRITNRRQSPAQGFRSHDPNAGALDPEFAAFEAGFGPGPSLPELHSPSPFAQKSASPFPQAEIPGWASDFQRLHISQPSPLPRQQFPVEAPAHRPSPPGWHSEFMEQHNTPVAQQRMESMNSQMRNNYSYPQVSPMMMNNPGFNQMNPLLGSQAHSEQRPQGSAIDAAFQSAFEEISADVELQESVREVQRDISNPESQFEEDNSIKPFNILLYYDLINSVRKIQHNLQKALISRGDQHEPSAEEVQGSSDWIGWLEQVDVSADVIQQTEVHRVLRVISEDETAIGGEQLYSLKRRAGILAEKFDQTLAERERVNVATDRVEQIQPIGADTIPVKEERPIERTNEDNEELAKTAGVLLESVKHDQSQKFRESNFLALMRRLRDREVQVEGEEFKDVAQPLHPGGKFYPEYFQRERSVSASRKHLSPTMTGAITGDDIAKFDDVNSCGFPARISGSKQDNHLQIEEDLLIKEFNEESEAMRYQAIAQMEEHRLCGVDSWPRVLGSPPSPSIIESTPTT